MPEMPEALCACFGNSLLHASTFTSVDGALGCDLCSQPVQPDSVDTLTAINSAPTAWLRNGDG